MNDKNLKESEFRKLMLIEMFHREEEISMRQQIEEEKMLRQEEKHRM